MGLELYQIAVLHFCFMTLIVFIDQYIEPVLQYLVPVFIVLWVVLMCVLGKWNTERLWRKMQNRVREVLARHEISEKAFLDYAKKVFFSVMNTTKDELSLTSVTINNTYSDCNYDHIIVWITWKCGSSRPNEEAWDFGRQVKAAKDPEYQSCALSMPLNTAVESEDCDAVLDVFGWILFSVTEMEFDLYGWRVISTKCFFKG